MQEIQLKYEELQTKVDEKFTITECLKCLELFQIFFMFMTVLTAGNVAQILAIVAIFYAVDLPKAQLPRPETDWLLVAFVAFHFLTHLVLSAINCNADNGKM